MRDKTEKKERKEIVIEENTIYEIDTKCIQCQDDKKRLQGKERKDIKKRK